MKKKIEIIAGIIITIVIVVLSIFLLLDNNSKSKNYLETKESLVTEQYYLESEFDITGYTMEKPNIIVNPYKISPLTALVIFKTDEAVEITVTIEGDDELSTYTHTFSKTKNHYLNIYGLYANKQNKVIISDGNKESEIYIKTDKLPEDFILPTSVEKDATKLDNDLYFYTPSSAGYTCAYDVNGDVRWYLTTYSLWDNARLKNGHMLVSTERLINAPYYMTGLYEMDLLGKIYTEYSISGGYHHDYYEMDNGDLLVLSDDFYNEEGTVEDYVVLLNRTNGNIIKTWDLKDILNMKDGANAAWTSYDWFHNNSIWYDKNTNSITLSGRHLDAVINIDYKSGNLNWILGDPDGWGSEYKKYFFTPVDDNFEWQYMQHAAMITPEGYVFLFDNGTNKSKDIKDAVPATESYSRGVMYEINENDMTISQVFEYGKELGSDFFSPYISDVDYLEKNHYLIHSGGTSYKDGVVQNEPAGLVDADELKSETVELLNGKVIFDMILPTNTYRVEKQSLYTNEISSMGKAKRLGSLGETEVTKTSFGFMINAKKIDSEYESHKITFSLEEDRLIVNGTFKKDTDVNVILYKTGTKLIYNVPISKKPYTAMCVDLPTAEETVNGLNVTKYINYAGLKGSYSIYLSIDGKVYNPDLSVKF